MLVIHRRGSSLGGMGRYYQGSGVFDAITRKLFSSGIKMFISNGTSSAIAHNVADVVVNGATSTSKKVADAIVKEATSAAGKASASAVKTAIVSVVNKVKGVKRSAAESSIAVHQQPSLAKKKRINIDSLIDGSGIV